jgi:hypothetical protein
LKQKKATHFASASGAVNKNGLGGRQAMAKNKLTRRGKIVLGILFVIAVCWLYDITTPDQCKVAIENMSEWCKDLRYP